jgi:hypothetical protein
MEYPHARNSFKKNPLDKNLPSAGAPFPLFQCEKNTPKTQKNPVKTALFKQAYKCKRTFEKVCLSGGNFLFPCRKSKTVGER